MASSSPDMAWLRIDDDHSPAIQGRLLASQRDHAAGSAGDVLYAAR